MQTIEEIQESTQYLTKITAQLGEANKVIRQATHRITQMQNQIQRYEKDNARLIDLVSRLRHQNQELQEQLNECCEPHRNEDTE